MVYSNEDTHLRCDACGMVFLGVLWAEEHSSVTDHVHFVDVTGTEESREAVALAASRRKELANGGGFTRDSDLHRDPYTDTDVRRPRTPVFTAEELLAKQERMKQINKKLRAEKDFKDEDLMRIRRNIEMDKERRNKRNASPSPLRLSPRNSLDAGPTATPSPSPPRTPRLGDTTSTHHRRSSSVGSALSNCSSNSSETRLRLRINNTNQSLDKKFPVDAKLSEVAEQVKEELNVMVTSFIRAGLPRKSWGEGDFDITLEQAGLGVSSALTVKVKENCAPPSPSPMFLLHPSTGDMELDGEGKRRRVVKQVELV